MHAYLCLPSCIRHRATPPTVRRSSPSHEKAFIIIFQLPNFFKESRHLVANSPDEEFAALAAAEEELN